MLNNLAWELFRHGPPDYHDRAERWARSAVELAPKEPWSAHTHAMILAALGRIDEALAVIPACTDRPDAVEKMLNEVVELFVDLAARGAGAQSVVVLRTSPSAPLLETLMVALQLDAGLPMMAVPREIVEVAEDIRRNIEIQRSALALKAGKRDADSP
jgi:hypothetical protein